MEIPLAGRPRLAAAAAFIALAAGAALYGAHATVLLAPPDD